MKKVIFFLIFLLNAKFCFAEKSDFKNYYASIKASEANLRTGPNVRYPIIWIYVKKGEPIEVIGKFEHWLKIRDYDGEIGWLYKGTVGPERTVIVNSNEVINLNKNPSIKSVIIAKIEPKVRLILLKCENEWCKVKFQKTIGWVQKDKLWGV